MSSKKSFSMEEWNSRLEGVQVSKEDLNRLVMNYLVIEGFKEAAETFQDESGTEMHADSELIAERMKIRNAIQNGDIQQAISMVNDFNPELLDSDRGLYFKLMVQRLIELIRAGSTDEALSFAEDQLAPLIKEDPSLGSMLEQALTLLAFEDPSVSPLASLLDSSKRSATASEVNKAILASTAQTDEPVLPNLLKMLMWAQDELEKKAKVTFPQIRNVVTANLELPSSTSPPASSSPSTTANGGSSTTRRAF